ncbi:hypothetical protein HO173_003517 [Letharia columbiana]|uniref:F-box domain-containing protein n=1 Tax=Letharia columbiana TaxID=112416 RepID=A0A8H6L7C6_9LECA|nr:uncharacterized protein HO173_003517 [Letharia columbiana]KAF6238237.1 hypothetical protein HO173_003517 [Letharia columbiana]
MSLPNELILGTLQYINKADLKSVRLVSKLWSGCASEYLFAKLFISPHKLNLQIFAAVARDPTLSKFVKELEYNAVSFSPDITISQYFEILWHQNSMIAFDTERVSEVPDPHIRQFITMIRDRREYWLDWQGRMAPVQTQWCDFSFVQEGYQKWINQALFEKNCLKEDTLFKLLVTGLKRFGRLRTVKLSDRWHSGDKPGRQGSPLARSWLPFHAHPGDFISDSDEPLKESSTSDAFWTLAHALSGVKNTRIRNLSIKGPLPTAAFLTEPGEQQTHVDHGVGAFCRLEYLRLSLAGYSREPMVKLYETLHGLHRMLESMTALRRFDLALPVDCVDEPVWFFTYPMIFPENGHWPQLTTFTVGNLAISTKDLVTLLITKMPSLRHLAFGNINLLDGQWEGIVEYLRVANCLSSFHIVPESLLVHGGDQIYLSQRHGHRDDHDHRSGDFLKILHSIGDYVVNWWNNPTLRHPSLKLGQPAQQSLDYLKDVYCLSDMNLTHDMLDGLAEHMVEDATRYRERDES